MPDAVCRGAFSAFASRLMPRFQTVVTSAEASRVRLAARPPATVEYCGNVANSGGNRRGSAPTQRFGLPAHDGIRSLTSFVPVMVRSVSPFLEPSDRYGLIQIRLLEYR